MTRQPHLNSEGEAAWLHELFTQVVEEVDRAFTFHLATIEGLRSVRVVRATFESTGFKRVPNAMIRLVAPRMMRTIDDKVEELRELEPVIAAEAPDFPTL